MSSGPAVEIRDVSFSFNAHPILRDVDLTIEEGEFVTIVGPNGGGKTTLLRLMLGLIHPTSGTIAIYGVQPEEARPRIGYMPQHPDVDLRFPARVVDVVLTGRLGGQRPLGAYRHDDREAAREALREVDLLELGRRPFAELSGGQRQRTLIARALVSQPDLLLLDEPTANLDVMMENELHELLRALNERMTIALVSHDLGFVSNLTDRVVCVKQRVATHPACEITNDIIREMYGRDVLMVRHDHDEAGGTAQ